MKNSKRILTLVLAAVMLIGALAAYPASIDAGAVTKTQIDNLKSKSSAIGDKISSVQAQISELRSKEVKSLAQKELYDEQCSLIAERISITEEQISEYEGLVDEAKVDYMQARNDEAAQFDLMCTRIRAMEENGRIGYMQILFGAKSFGDLLSRVDFINEIIRSDEKVIEDYQLLQEKTLELQAEMEELLKETAAVKAELEVQQDELEAKRAEAEALVAEIQQDKAVQQALLEEFEEEQNALKTEIANAEAEYAAQIAAENAKNSGSSGGNNVSGSGNSANGISLSWPVGSRRITSYFGPRSSSSTNGVGSTNHMGIDIGGVGYTTEIGAAAGGVVTVSQRSQSAGEYVVVSHGSGVSTVYMHMSSRSVSVGESVSRGTTLGITGSTGNSTGPHLHFGVIIDGEYVNPLNYLP